MRIGIHTGNIIGGVIGTDIVRYDIYGNDVLIANKMESNGEKGKVMISENTYELVSEIF
jgi:class 3 adenylate cyclase